MFDYHGITLPYLSLLNHKYTRKSISVLQGGALAGNGNSPPSVYRIAGKFHGVRFSQMANC